MNETNKTTLVIAFAVAVALFLLFGGGMMTGTTMSGGIMGNGGMLRGGGMYGISWMWIPTVLILGLGVLLARLIFGKKK